jgi:SAM-dependent methyltransferase
MSKISNRNVWRDLQVVDCYARAQALQPAEAAILAELEDDMAQWSMLDIGVGAGRTTAHFAHRVRDYVGIDYADAMLESCRQRFADRPDLHFELADVRSMPQFGDKRFDFVLFSFNGIDYVSHEERQKALGEIRRVGRSGGWFCFSTHNLRSARGLMSLRSQWNRHPLWLARNIVNWSRWQLLHSRSVRSRVATADDYALLNDGAHECRLQTYYVYPERELSRLADTFDFVRVFSGRTGSELQSSDLSSCSDDWLYYLCRFR